MTKKLSNRHAIVEFCPPKAWIGSWVLAEQDMSVMSLNDATPVATATRMAIVSGSFLSLCCARDQTSHERVGISALVACLNHGNLSDGCVIECIHPVRSLW
jgi:hypothetical protein